MQLGCSHCDLVLKDVLFSNPFSINEVIPGMTQLKALLPATNSVNIGVENQITSACIKTIIN